MTPGLRKFTLTAHLMCSVSWIGAVIAYLGLGIAARTSQDVQTVRAAWIAMALTGWYVIVPSAFASLFTKLGRMVSINFAVEDGQLHINLAALPAACNAIILNLPDGHHLIHHFNELMLANTGVSLDSITDLVREFVDYLELYEDRKENTLNGYRNRLRQFADWLKADPKRNPADPTTWIAYYASLKRRHLSDYTRKGHYHILNRFGAWLVKHGYLRAHPLTEVRPPELPKEREPKAIFQAHIKAMLAVTETPRDRAILLFFRDTGCRATEAISLTWRDIQLDEGKAIALGKGDKRRKLFFKPVTRRALKAYRETVPHQKSDPVWWGRKGPLNYGGLYKIFKRLADKVDIGDENFNPHAWRHAFGRDTTRAGIPTAQLQDLLGHSSIEVTKIYAQFDDVELQKAHNRYSPVEDDWDSLIASATSVSAEKEEKKQVKSV